MGSGSDLSIWLHGSASANSKILLALIVPNGTSATALNSLGAITLYDGDYPASAVPPVASTGTGSVSSGPTFDGTATGKLNALSACFDSNQLCFSSFSNSNQESNWTAFDAGLGVPSLASVSSYGVFSWVLQTGALSSNSVVDISIPGGAPEGSIFSALTDAGDATPWTTSGGVNSLPTPTPEPTTLALFGAGLLFAGLGIRRLRASA